MHDAPGSLSNRRQPGAHTPWGVADTRTTVAPGIVCYTTPSHGGYHVDAAQVAAMPEALRACGLSDGVGGGRWYEEDCDWSAVCLAFPHLFPADLLPVARSILRNYNPDAYAAHTGEAITAAESYMLHPENAAHLARVRAANANPDRTPGTDTPRAYAEAIGR